MVPDEHAETALAELGLCPDQDSVFTLQCKDELLGAAFLDDDLVKGELADLALSHTIDPVTGAVLLRRLLRHWERRLKSCPPRNSWIMRWTATDDISLDWDASPPRLDTRHSAVGSHLKETQGSSANRVRSSPFVSGAGMEHPPESGTPIVHHHHRRMATCTTFQHLGRRPPWHGQCIRVHPSLCTPPGKRSSAAAI